MHFDADTGASPPAESRDVHSVAESIIAKLEAPPPAETLAGDGMPSEPANGMSGADAALEERTDADDAPVDPVAEAVAELTGKPLHPVVVDGRTEQVTLDELRKGYSRQRDYSRKTAALAEQRRGLESERARLKEVLDAFIGDAETVDPVLAEGRATDWERLAAEQPAVYAQRRAEFDRRAARLEQARSLRREMAAREDVHRARAFDAYAGQQRRELLRRMPELADPGKRRAAADELSAYAAGLGFSADEQSRIVDHRLLRVFHDAMQFRRLNQARERLASKRTDGASRTQAPLASREGSPRRSDRLGALKRNALRTGRVDDMVESILAHLEEDQ
ncbi:MAG: hypothetical protein IT563_09780 [Alphaproteobacteria bacterium]|nr:hypothetical protein [Alphaproteobacteria bacterium]